MTEVRSRMGSTTESMSTASSSMPSFPQTEVEVEQSVQGSPSRTNTPPTESSPFIMRTNQNQYCRMSRKEYSLNQVSLPPIGGSPPIGGGPPGGGPISNQPSNSWIERWIDTRISHDDSIYWVWETAMLVCTVYSAIVVPYEFGFMHKLNAALLTCDLIAISLSFLDIIWTFFVPYIDKTTYLLVDDLRPIAMGYLKSWFAFDLIATFPSQYSCRILPQSYCAIFGLFRLWRLRRLSAIFARFEKDQKYNYFVIRSIKLICVTLFSVHFGGCCFYFFASRYYASDSHSVTWLGLITNGKDMSRASLYVRSIYWSMTTFSTVGYGDVHPLTTTEIIFSIVYMLYNMALMAYIVGNMTDLIVRRTAHTMKYRDEVQSAVSFCRRNSLPSQLEQQILDHLLIKYRTELEALQHQEIVSALPKAIGSSISQQLFHSVAEKVYLFDGVSAALRFQLVSEMKVEYFPPRQEIIIQNELPTDIYIFVTGVAELIIQKDGTERLVAEVTAGDLAGEIGLLSDIPQVYTVRIHKLSQVLRLSRHTLAYSNITDGDIIMGNFLEHLKKLGSDRSEINEIYTKIDASLAQSKTDLHLSISFAVNNNYPLLLYRLLKDGSNPYVRDASGRTALHDASKKGGADLANLLIRFGSDVNSQDNVGNTALHLAVFGQHVETARLLIERGAKSDITNAEGRTAKNYAEEKGGEIGNIFVNNL